MIIFHSGLPGSGKSYEAMVTRIIPALNQGRRVIAYIEGLNFARIAEASGLAEARVIELLKPVTREQVDKLGVVALAEDNALIVLDEAQNFWGNRAKLDKPTTEFVTEHRHRGIDLVLMGQDLRDVHALWRRRVDIKATFLKLSGLGTSKRYTVTTWRHLGEDKFERVGTKVCKYDPKYFGTYASHTGADIGTEDYKDSRATVWASGLFKFGIPATLLAGVVGAFYAWGFFHPKPVQHVAAGAPSHAVASGLQVGSPAAPAAAASAVAPDHRPVIERRFAEFAVRYRIRLAGLIRAGQRYNGMVEWIDGGSRVIDRYSLDDLRDLGVTVVVSESFARLQVGAWSDVATMWPMESDGRVSQDRLAAMRPADPLVGAPVVGPVASAMKPAGEGIVRNYSSIAGTYAPGH